MNEKDLNSLHLKIDRLEKLVYGLVKAIEINNSYTQGISSQVPKCREESNYLFNYLLNQPTSEYIADIPNKVMSELSEEWDKEDKKWMSKYPEK